MVLEAPNIYFRFSLGDLPIRIGRNTNNDITVGDRWISREHCELYFGNELLVRDLGSKHGTFVNGKSIDGPVSLKVGDKLTVGMTEFQLNQD